MAQLVNGVVAAPLLAASETSHGAVRGPALEVRGLRHAFGERQVLDGLSFVLERGQILGLLGPNGCGKSTTLRVLTGFIIPDAGEILVDSELAEPGCRRLRSRTGVVFQDPSLDVRLSARENLMLSATLYGVAPQEARQRAASLLAMMDLSDRADEQVLQFSGGMKRRLELARALLHGPELLLMDEPTTGLDETAFRRTWERILELRRQQGLTVLLSTHRAEEAQLCDQVIIMDRGRVIAQGTPEELGNRVSGDVLTLEAADPAGLCRELETSLSLAAQVVDGKVVVVHDRGHELIPRIVEALPVGRLASLSMHRPSLADVFVELTGRSLGDETQPDAAQVDA